MNEEWRPAVSYEGLYEVSDQGNVRSLDHVTIDTLGRSRPFKGRLLNPHVGTGGYLEVNLHRGTQSRLWRVHVLVMAAFAGPYPEPRAHIRHLNGNPQDCRLTNLAYGTSADNQHDLVRHGGHYWANQTHCIRGHEFTVENTYRRKRGGRMCRECARIRQRSSKAA